MMFCKHCKQTKSDKEFTPSKSVGIRLRLTGRTCKKCKNKMHNKAKLIKKYGTIDLIEIKKIRLLKRYNTTDLSEIKEIRRLGRNKRKRLVYHSYYAERQKDNVRSWISRNRKKHNQYCMNWQKRNPDKCREMWRRYYNKRKKNITK